MILTPEEVEAAWKLAHATKAWEEARNKIDTISVRRVLVVQQIEAAVMAKVGLSSMNGKTYEQQRAIMEAERNESLATAINGGVIKQFIDGDASPRKIYETGYSNAWARCIHFYQPVAAMHPTEGGEAPGHGMPDWPEWCETFRERKAYQQGIAHARQLAKEEALPQNETESPKDFKAVTDEIETLINAVELHAKRVSRWARMYGDMRYEAGLQADRDDKNFD